MLWMHFEWVDLLSMNEYCSEQGNPPIRILVEEDNIHFDFPHKHIGHPTSNEIILQQI